MVMFFVFRIRCSYFRSCSSVFDVFLLKSRFLHLNGVFSARIYDLRRLLQIHSHILTAGNGDNLFFSAKLISLYSSFKSLDSCKKVFFSLSVKDVFLWNSIMLSQFSNGLHHESLHLFFLMRSSDTLPDQFTLPMAVASSAELSLFKHGKSIHGIACKLGQIVFNPSVGSSLVFFYSKFGRMEDARRIFDEITAKNGDVWTALIVGYVQNEESDKSLICLCQMHRSGHWSGENSKFKTLEGGLLACEKLSAEIEAKCLHGFAKKTGMDYSQLIKSVILSIYSNCGDLHDVHLLFREIPEKDVVVWTSIIYAYAKLGFTYECCSLFSEMHDSNVSPDAILISCMITGFVNSKNVKESKSFHALILKRLNIANKTVQNSLISMYSRFDLVSPTEKLFHTMENKNNKSWSLMLICYGKLHLWSKCIILFREFQQHHQLQTFKLDPKAISSIISSIGNLQDLHLGSSIHSFVIKNMSHMSKSITNSLIDMYGKCHALGYALNMFNMSTKVEQDIITWNTLISSYSNNGLFSKSLHLFEKMLTYAVDGLKPNEVTIVTILSACSHLASLDFGERVHNDYIKYTCFRSNIRICTSLIDMYVKCGRLEKARDIFDSAENRDAVCWNVMIAGYGLHGDTKTALEMYKLMEESTERPNESTFLSLLTTCAHTGLVEEGRHVFGRMEHYSVKPNLKHYTCMVDLLGRSGNLAEAEAFVLSMPVVPDGGVWGALLNACRIHREVEMGIHVSKEAIKVDPRNDGFYVTTSNVYSDGGRWFEAEKMREDMRKMTAKKAAWTTTMSNN